MPIRNLITPRSVHLRTELLSMAGSVAWSQGFPATGRGRLNPLRESYCYNRLQRLAKTCGSGGPREPCSLLQLWTENKSRYKGTCLRSGWRQRQHSEPSLTALLSGLFPRTWASPGQGHFPHAVFRLHASFSNKSICFSSQPASAVGWPVTLLEWLGCSVVTMVFQFSRRHLCDLGIIQVTSF